MNLRIGQMMVCIKDDFDSFPPEFGINKLPSLNSIYTINKGIWEPTNERSYSGKIVRCVMIGFEEIFFNNLEQWPLFRADWFRPVKITSIEIFEKIANNCPTELIKDKKTEKV